MRAHAPILWRQRRRIRETAARMLFWVSDKVDDIGEWLIKGRA